MSTLAAAGQNAAANAIGALLNGGTLKFYDSGNTLLATVTLPNPAFGSAVAGLITANSISNVTVGTSGTVATAKAFESGGTQVWSGTVGTSGADIIASTVTWLSGNTVNITAFTYQQNT